MEFSDALTITVLGLGVVFSGLLLTAALISSFSLIPRLLNRTPGAPTTGENPSTPEQGPPIPGEILSVITAVLEVERRLYHSDPGGRLTINRRHEEPQT
jgi:Na+-transporting methylmalonyl-CoA/oxaloacetate decarboxylase gamma subunit